MTWGVQKRNRDGGGGVVGEHVELTGVFGTTAGGVEGWHHLIYQMQRVFLRDRMYADHFGIENIPFGVATDLHHAERSVVSRFEDSVIFLNDLFKAELLPNVSKGTATTFSSPTLNAFAALPKRCHTTVRISIQNQLKKGISSFPTKSIALIDSVTLHIPIAASDFTDFSCSHDHVLNASQAVFGERKAPPGFQHFPVGYTARVSSLVVSGTPIVRPRGQYKDGDTVAFGPTKRMDYELEVAAVIRKRTQLGKVVSIEDADEYIFGLVLLNDWSARDIQGLEMNPLGPMNGKSFSTSISAWIITLDALEPFRAVAPPKFLSPAHQPLAHYLIDPLPKSTYEFSLQATLRPEGAGKASVICETTFSSLYWTLRDMVAQQTVNGCNLNVGDLMGTGTISGTKRESHGCLMELAGSGGLEVEGKDGLMEKRVFLSDGDTVELSAVMGPGVGFGGCAGVIMPAR